MKLPWWAGLARLFDPGLINTLPAPGSAEFNGAVMNPGGLANLLTQLAQNGGQILLPTNYQTLANAAGQTWNQASVPGGIAGTVLLRSGAAGVSDTTDTAQNICSAMSPLLVPNLGQPLVQVGQSGLFIVANTNTGTLTVVAGTNVTLAGTTTIVTVGTRLYQVKVTNVAQPNIQTLNGLTAIVPANAAASSTNATTCSAATLPPAPAASGAPSPLVIPVASATGIIVGSTLSWTDPKNLAQSGMVTVVSGTNITVANPGTNGIANGAAVLVWNNLVTLTGMFAIAASTTA